MKRVFVLFLLLSALVGACYALTREPPTGDGGQPEPAPVISMALLSAHKVQPGAATAPNAATATPWTCSIKTGVTAGTVNLRSCGSLACPVLDILDEGQRVTVLMVGDWLHIQTGESKTGYINSKFCK